MKSAPTLEGAKNGRPLYLVEGSSGEYSNYSTWIVSGWLSQDDAEAEAARLNRMSAEYEAEKTTLGGSPGWGEGKDEKPFYDWNRAHDELQEKWQRITGDEQFGDTYDSTDYAVRVTVLRD